MGDSCIIEAGAVLTGRGPDGTMTDKGAAAILVQSGRIARIGPVAEVTAAHPGLPRHGGPRMIAMPGLVNGHHHFGITPLMAGVPFAPLELWLPRFRGMRSIGPRLDTLYSAIEMLESGTTCVHHIQSALPGPPEAWRDTTDAVTGAYAEAGLRAGYAFMMRDRNILDYGGDDRVLAALPAPVRDWVAPQLAAAAVPTADHMAFFRDLHARHAGNDLLRLNLAPANLHWCSDASLDLIFATARDTGAQVHMHLLETRRQAEFALARTGRTAVAHLAHLGCLGPDLTLGHCNWATPQDLDLIAECGCTVCHNASSGLRLGSGVAPVAALRARGVPVALGIDQSNICDDRDMTTEIKLAWALHRGTGLFDDRPDAADVLAMATETGAASTGFGGFAGRLDPGWAADIVLMDRAAVERPFVSPHTPLAETVLHRARATAVREVFVAGRKVVAGGRIVSIDRDAVMAEIAARLSDPETAAQTHARTMAAALAAGLEALMRHDAAGG